MYIFGRHYLRFFYQFLVKGRDKQFMLNLNEKILVYNVILDQRNMY